MPKECLAPARLRDRPYHRRVQAGAIAEKWSVSGELGLLYRWYCSTERKSVATVGKLTTTRRCFPAYFNPTPAIGLSLCLWTSIIRGRRTKLVRASSLGLFFSTTFLPILTAALTCRFNKSMHAFTWVERTHPKIPRMGTFCATKLSSSFRRANTFFWLSFHLFAFIFVTCSFSLYSRRELLFSLNRRWRLSRTQYFHISSFHLDFLFLKMNVLQMYLL